MTVPPGDLRAPLDCLHGTRLTQDTSTRRHPLHRYKLGVGVDGGWSAVELGYVFMYLFMHCIPNAANLPHSCEGYQEIGRC